MAGFFSFLTFIAFVGFLGNAINPTTPTNKPIAGNTQEVKSASVATFPSTTPTPLPTETPTPTIQPTEIPTWTPIPTREVIYHTPTPIQTQSGLSNDNSYTNIDGNQVHSPAYSNDNSIPAGASAICGDGTYSFSQSRRGTCSYHGGVAQWL